MKKSLFIYLILVMIPFLVSSVPTNFTELKKHCVIYYDFNSDNIENNKVTNLCQSEGNISHGNMTRVTITNGRTETLEGYRFWNYLLTNNSDSLFISSGTEGVSFNNSTIYTNYSFPHDTLNFTVAFWLNFSNRTLSDTSFFVSTGAPGVGWSFGLLTNGSMYLEEKDGGQIFLNSLKKGWNHVVFSYNMQTDKRVFYLNSTIILNDTGSVADADVGVLILGRRDYSAPGYFYDVFEDFMFFNKTLTTQEIIDIMNYTHNQSGYEVYFRLDKMTDTSYQQYALKVYNSTQNVTAFLNYNGTRYTPLSSFGNSNYKILNYSLYIPKFGSVLNQSIAFYFELNFSNTLVNSSVFNQDIYPLFLDNCTLANLPTLNFYFKNISSDINLDGDFEYTANFWVVPSLKKNFSSSRKDINNYTLCISPNWTSINVTLFSEFGFNTVNYFYGLTDYPVNNITKNLTLYVSDLTSQVIFSVRDSQDNAIVGAYIKVLSYEINTNTYKTSEILLSDSFGQAIGRIILNTQWYKFIVEKDSSVLIQTEPQKITTSPVNIVVTADTENWLKNYNPAIGITSEISFSNITNNVVYTYTDSSNTITQSCVEVYHTNQSGKKMVDMQCIDSPAGTIINNIGDIDDGSIVATAYVIKEDNKYIVNQVEYKFQDDKDVYSNLPKFQTIFGLLLLIMSIALAFVVTPILSIILTVTLFTVLVLIGWINPSPSIVITLVIMGGLVIFIKRKD